MQYTHKWKSYQAMRRYETARGLRFRYLVQARNDFAYRPRDYLQPKWLETMPCSALAVPSIEFHQHDRWFQRGNRDTTRAHRDPKPPTFRLTENAAAQRNAASACTERLGVIILWQQVEVAEHDRRPDSDGPPP